MWFIASTPSRAERPRSGAAAACAETPRKRNFPLRLASEVSGLAVERDVDVAEQAGAHHVHLAGAPFFGGRTVDAQRPGTAARRQPLLHRDGRRGRGGAEEMMSAAVAGPQLDQRLTHRYRILRQPGERVELGENRDHGFALAVGRDERRRHSRHTALDPKSGSSQFLL
jgi:hypothetical protein